MNIILGGGLVALLARDILGDKWALLPMGKSQFYTFNPPIADNYVIREDAIDDYLKKFNPGNPVYIRNAFSYGGHLMFTPHVALDHWLTKLYGYDVPPQAAPYIKAHMEYFGYGNCYEIYQTLIKQYGSEAATQTEKWGKAVRIADHRIHTDKGAIVEYDNIISTIPMSALLQMLDIKIVLQSKDVWCYHLYTDHLDFENADALMVADPEIEFYKASKIGNTSYLIYSTAAIAQPGMYFMQFMKDFKLVAETSIEGAIPSGSIPYIETLKEIGIKCIGSRAIHDDFLDIGSVILRLLKWNV